MSIDIDIRKKTGSFSLDVSLQSESGVVGLLGASGCGKSMTLKCIAGLIRPDEGHIIVNGETYFDSGKKINLKPQQRSCGYLFQNYALFPNMTIRENLLCGMKKDPKNEERVQEELARFELTGYADRHPGQLSGGQQQRAALARIFIRNPAILMLDEPFSALDTSLRWTLQQKMSEALRSFDGSVLFVSHSRDEIFMLCDTAGVIDQGSLVSFGTIEELFANPKTRAGLSLTGCKNISPIRWIDEHHFLAENWNIVFEKEKQEGMDVCGLRAHDFRPCGPDDPGAIPIEIVSMLDEPFTCNILFKKKGEDPKETLCWRVSTDVLGSIPEYPSHLRISSSSILLVKSQKKPFN